MKLADLIVMGTQGLGGFRKWLLGSTTERLLRRTHVPGAGRTPREEPAVAQHPAPRSRTFSRQPISASLR